MDKLLSMVGMAVRAGKVRFGVYMTERELSSGGARLVVAAADIGNDNKKKLEHGCKSANVPLVLHSSKEELARAVGKKECVAVCICDESLARAVLQLCDGKDGLPNE